jgi:hypothetical protein
MNDSNLISEDLKKDIEREASAKSGIKSHQKNLDGHEQYRGKEIIIVVNESELFQKLKQGMYFDKVNVQPSYFTGKTVDRIIDILNEPDLKQVARYEEELAELKKKYQIL